MPPKTRRHAENTAAAMMMWAWLLLTPGDGGTAGGVVGLTLLAIGTARTSSPLIRTSTTLVSAASLSNAATRAESKTSTTVISSLPAAAIPHAVELPMISVALNFA